jgi:hypothetical protein
LQGWSTGPTMLIAKTLWFTCVTTLGALLGRAIWRIKVNACPSRAHDTRSAIDTPPRERRASSPAKWEFDRLIAATIAATPLLMPFYFDYDLLLLAIPAVLYAADRARGNTHWTDRYLPHAFVAFYLCLELGTVMAGHLRFNPTVPLATVLSVLLIQRATRPTETSFAQLPSELPLAA